MTRIRCAEPMMTADEAWACVVGFIRDEGLLDAHGQIPEHLVRAAKSHADMLSRPCPYTYEEAEPA